jgi:hypothetical protein
VRISMFVGKLGGPAIDEVSVELDTVPGLVFDPSQSDPFCKEGENGKVRCDVPLTNGNTRWQMPVSYLAAPTACGPAIVIRGRVLNAPSNDPDFRNNVTEARVAIECGQESLARPDLELTLTQDPVARPGLPFTYTVTVENKGTTDALYPTIVLDMPQLSDGRPTLFVPSRSNPLCYHRNRSIECATGGIRKNGKVVYAITLTTFPTNDCAEGTFSTTASVRTLGELNLANNTKTVQTTFTCAARPVPGQGGTPIPVPLPQVQTDLKIAMFAGQTVPRGGTMVSMMAIQNASSSSVTLTPKMSFSTPMQFVAPGGGIQCTMGADGALSCTPTTLGAGQTQVFMALIRVPATAACGSTLTITPSAAIGGQTVTGTPQTVRVTC